MNAKEIIDGYKATYCKAPVLKTWTPSDFHLEFYNTEKKLQRECDKRNAEYLRQYEREEAKFNDFCTKCEKILGVSADNLRDFLVATIERHVEEAKALQEAAKTVVDSFREKYDNEVLVKYDNGSEFKERLFYRLLEIFRHNFDKSPSGDVKLREKVVNTGYRNKLDAICPTIEDKMAFGKDYVEYEKRISFLKNEKNSPSSVFLFMVERISEIVDNIRNVLGGDPDGCSFDADWGVGGHFNGIVSRNGQRASFKSFFAGGYNIQKLHVRFKVTKLVR